MFITTTFSRPYSGIYKVTLIKRKASSFKDFYNSVKALDKQTDFKEVEKIESQVILTFN